MNSYQNRLRNLEQRMGVAGCGNRLCAKCVLNKIAAESQGKEWSGCNGTPATLTGVLEIMNAREAA